MLVGARYVCPSCALRGFVRACPRCGGARLDLAEPRGLASFEEAWPLARAWRAGRAFVSPWSIRHDRTVLGVAGAMTLLVVFGSPISAHTHGAPFFEALVTFVVSVVLAPLLFAFFALNTFYTAHLLRLVAYLYLGLGLLLPFVGLGLSWIGRGLLAFATWLLPRIELDDVPPPAASHRTARLAAPLTLSRVVEGWGWIARRDAWLVCEALELEGRTLRLAHEAGVVSWAPSAMSLLSGSTEHLADGLDPSSSTGSDRPPHDSDDPRQGGYRDAATKPEVPRWAHAPHRATRVRTTLVPAGRTLRLRGGVVQGGLLTGTPEHPLHLEIT